MTTLLPTRLLLPAPLRGQMLAALRAVYPEEGCGLLAGRQETVTGVYPIANVLASRTRYRLEPAAQVRTMLALAQAELDLLAIYHSHPQGPEYPSATDVALASYPEAVNIIVSLQEPTEPIVCAFRINKQEVFEQKMKVL